MTLAKFKKAWERIAKTYNFPNKGEIEDNTSPEVLALLDKLGESDDISKVLEEKQFISENFKIANELMKQRHNLSTLRLKLPRKFNDEIQGIIREIDRIEDKIIKLP